MAWVNLAALPSASNHILYVAGESENGNDLDLQFEGKDNIRFFTAAGGVLDYKPNPATLVNQWHMVVATMDVTAKSRVIYWDGALVNSDQDPGKPNKTRAFSIGESTVFSGRFFNGSIDEVALWNRALSAADFCDSARIFQTKISDGVGRFYDCGQTRSRCRARGRRTRWS
jgi:hypothetical protein